MEFVLALLSGLALTLIFRHLSQALRGILLLILGAASFLAIGAVLWLVDVDPTAYLGLALGASTGSIALTKDRRPGRGGPMPTT